MSDLFSIRVLHDFSHARAFFCCCYDIYMIYWTTQQPRALHTEQNRHSNSFTSHTRSLHTLTIQNFIADALFNDFPWFSAAATFNYYSSSLDILNVTTDGDEILQCHPKPYKCTAIFCPYATYYMWLFSVRPTPFHWYASKNRWSRTALMIDKSNIYFQAVWVYLYSTPTWSFCLCSFFFVVECLHVDEFLMTFQCETDGVHGVCGSFCYFMHRSKIFKVSGEFLAIFF